MEAPKCKLCGLRHYGLCKFSSPVEKMAPAQKSVDAALNIAFEASKKLAGPEPDSRPIDADMREAYERTLARRKYMRDYMKEWREKQRGKK